jgi:hypothetical protein
MADSVKRGRMTRKKQTSQLDKIGKLIRLLASDKDGEVLAAVGAIDRILTVSGLDFGDLANAAVSGLTPRRTTEPTKWSPSDPDLDSWESMAWWSHYHRYPLSDGDKQYLCEVLLGDPRHFDCGRVPRHMMDRLRGIVAKVRAS